MTYLIEREYGQSFSRLYTPISLPSYRIPALESSYPGRFFLGCTTFFYHTKNTSYLIRGQCSINTCKSTTGAFWRGTMCSPATTMGYIWVTYPGLPITQAIRWQHLYPSSRISSFPPHTQALSCWEVWSGKREDHHGWTLSPLQHTFPHPSLFGSRYIRGECCWQILFFPQAIGKARWKIY